MIIRSGGILFILLLAFFVFSWEELGGGYGDRAPGDSELSGGSESSGGENEGEGYDLDYEIAQHESTVANAMAEISKDMERERAYEEGKALAEALEPTDADPYTEGLQIDSSGGTYTVNANQYGERISIATASGGSITLEPGAAIKQNSRGVYDVATNQIIGTVAKDGTIITSAINVVVSSSGIYTNSNLVAERVRYNLIDALTGKLKREEVRELEKRKGSSDSEKEKSFWGDIAKEAKTFWEDVKSDWK